MDSTSNIKHKVLLATPAYGHMVTVPYFRSVLELTKLANAHQTEIAVQCYGNESLITRARNTLVAKFLDTPLATHLLFVDADVGFQPSSLFRMLEFDKDIVAGVYPQKNLNWDIIRENATKYPDKLQERSLCYNVNFHQPTNITVENGFAKVLDAPTGFMLIKRLVFEKMISAYPELAYQPENVPFPVSSKNHIFYSFFDCMLDPESKRYLSEDYTFCRRWEKIDGEIWCDITTPLSHMGSYVFQGDVSTIFTASQQ